ncbi:MAG: RNA 2',3'-cyclic phosphodiesterase [Proteobacteria bacterium]|nr:RNA 2',3'-cyclic phosphodiesterase [Pseudomonadota bacterium]
MKRDEGKIRSFIAIELPVDILQAIRSLQDQLKAEKLNLKWVEPGNIHLTLKFLGDISQEHLSPVSRAMEKAAEQVQIFELHAKGIGAFPGLNRPRVVWAGIGGETESLGRLAGLLDLELMAPGFEKEPIEKETRPFKGHLTFARAKEAVDPVRMTEFAGRFKTFKTPGFSVHEMVLFKSRLKSEGPVYEKLFEAPLGERANPKI